MTSQDTLDRDPDVQLECLDHWIDGASAAPAERKYLEIVSPMTGKPALKVASGNAQDVAGSRAKESWRRFNARKFCNLARQ